MKLSTMKDLVKSVPNLVPFRSNEVIEVQILGKSKNALFADVQGLTTGVIPVREWGEEGERLKPGDKALAYVLLMEDERGNVVLSLKRADQQRLNLTLMQKYKNKETIIVRVIEANKGGLLCEIGPIKGFLPVSQLSSSHYPRVAGDKNKILAKLKELIGQMLNVKIIGYDKKTNSPIFSEKAAQADLAQTIKKGDVLEGKVSGITDFGIFINLGEFDGLVHISEASWNRVDDLSKLVKIGETVKVKIIGVENGKVFLSLKRLTEDPFLEAIKKYKEGDVIEAEVTRIVPFGAFAQLDGIEGLAKLSDLSEKKITEPREVVEIGKKYEFKILKIERLSRRINLGLKQAESKSKTKSTTKEKKKETKTKQKETKKKGAK